MAHWLFWHWVNCHAIFYVIFSCQTPVNLGKGAKLTSFAKAYDCGRHKSSQKAVRRDFPKPPCIEEQTKKTATFRRKRFLQTLLDLSYTEDDEQSAANTKGISLTISK